MALISLTEAARRQLVSYMESNDVTALRLSVKSSGCSGWRCSFEHFVGDSSYMASVPVIEGRHILVSADDLSVVDGMTVDYERKGLTAQFKFNTRAPQTYCGCGESFTF